LCSIRNRLTALKKDRTEYVKPKDVLDVYESLMDQGEHHTPRTRRRSRPHRPQRSSQYVGRFEQPKLISSLWWWQ
jgi:hypothetical protein